MKYTGTVLLAVIASAALNAGSVSADTIRIGASAPRSGPQAGAASAVYWPTLELWVHNVNEAGGLDVGGEKMMIELVAYDDKSQPDEAVKNIQRLTTQDKVDFIAAPYSTGLNLATAPLIARAGLPQIVATGNLNDLEPFVEKWPNTFWLLGRASDLSTGIVGTLSSMREKGEVGNKVALVYVGDAFGLEMMAGGKPAFEEAGFEIVYESSYPIGAQDLAPIISGAKSSGADAFVAYSYPPDSFALTEQAQVQSFNPAVFYVGVGGALTGFGERFGDGVEGVMSMGGIDPVSDAYQQFRTQQIAVTGVAPDYWANPIVYAGMEILGTAIERVGSLDKAAVISEIQSGSFDTVIGQVSFSNNIVEQVWNVGQWHDGVFYGVNAKGLDAAADPFVKPVWSR
ncbi:amino acid ABC transporter substrate-binding protein [Roseinatronobacter alkalisoli]|uniref:Amino acid ABC transporter substrate-binding protein n=1 Tax=Roseinatronobacter alkalisoli TaxID=3028235 RepID=A0ABT5TCJ6_9RHOB|nr:amino acid ABC transporter substrate-binding protein [Roseinatronobacter sp. HJB301]MDD7972852.1 amino acid ABC transporter substrate-binding protein [Roseinatronobacter sp. HJB301]